MELKAGDSCPSCKIGRMVERRKFSLFLACDQYPACCFIMSLKKQSTIQDSETERWCREHGVRIDPLI